MSRLRMNLFNYISYKISLFLLLKFSKWTEELTIALKTALLFDSFQKRKTPLKNSVGRQDLIRSTNMKFTYTIIKS